VNGAEVHVSQLLNDLNFAVMPEGVGSTLDTASSRAAETLAQRFQIKQPMPRTLRLNGFEAREFVLEGCLDDGCVVYVVTTVQGPHRVVNLVGWKSGDRPREWLPQLVAVRDSFVWLGPGLTRVPRDRLAELS
jgi:hypothetical protein